MKHFQLPKKYMQLEEFVKCVQESGIVKDQGTIHRLFDALTVGESTVPGIQSVKLWYTCCLAEHFSQSFTFSTDTLTHIHLLHPSSFLSPGKHLIPELIITSLPLQETTFVIQACLVLWV